MTGPIGRLLRRQVSRVGMLRSGLTLGSLLERVADVHGDSVLVDQAAEARTGVPAVLLTASEAARLVDRWAAAILDVVIFV